MNTQANSAVQRVLDELVASGREVGVQVAAYLHDTLVVDAWAGMADPVAQRPVSGETLFNVFSVRRPWPQQPCTYRPNEFGRLRQSVARYWPEYGANGKESATVRDALSHRTGTPQMPAGATPDSICDWDATCAGIAALTPIYPVGQPAYQAVSFGWVIARSYDGRIRADAASRFVLEEICQPFDIEDLWIGVPDRVVPRIAKLTDALNMKPPPPGTVLAQAMPFEVRLAPDVFELHKCVEPRSLGWRHLQCPKSGSILAILANRGELNGKRLLSTERVTMATQMRPGGTLPDPVFFGMPMPLSQAASGCMTVSPAHWPSLRRPRSPRLAPAVRSAGRTRARASR